MATYLVVGASSGIGEAIKRLLVQEGHNVYGTFNQHKPDDDQNMFPLDVLAEQTDLSFLPEVIDGLVYCPGSITLKPFHRIAPADFASDYLLNTVGAVKVIQAVLPRLRASQQGSVVLFSTVAVQLGLPFHTQVAASKGAIEGLTRALSAELAPSIRVNAIAPSLTDTPLNAIH
jgi:NAD(P)-dependent dehydrogenase (short-subunit alcohol dehydrogenase family)